MDLVWAFVIACGITSILFWDLFANVKKIWVAITDLFKQIEHVGNVVDHNTSHAVESFEAISKEITHIRLRLDDLETITLLDEPQPQNLEES